MENAEQNMSFFNQDGKVQYFSLNHFLRDIANGSCCFICGASPGSKEFNNEHVIPNWILKRYDLHGQLITLPNGTNFRYGSYKSPCCFDCNKKLGEVFEVPISNLLSNSYDDIMEKLAEDNSLVGLLFRWLNLIYLKTHLKDNDIPQSRDHRNEDGSIGSRHYWEDLHHIHCVARSHYSGAEVKRAAVGTVIVFQVTDPIQNFYYYDHSVAKVVLLQLNDFCIVSVLDDGGACRSILGDSLKKITMPLNIFQVKEIFSRLVYLNINMAKRPIFQSHITLGGEYEITVKDDGYWELLPEKDRILSVGTILKSFVELQTERLSSDPEKIEFFLEQIESEKMGFLFNSNGEFIVNDQGE